MTFLIQLIATALDPFVLIGGGLIGYLTKNLKIALLAAIAYRIILHVMVAPMNPGKPLIDSYFFAAMCSVAAITFLAYQIKVYVDGTKPATTPKNGQE